MEKQTREMVLSAMFLAIGMLLPFFTGQIPQIGRMLLPMHIPVLLCGFLCGWKYGLGVGFILPLLRSVALGMPPLFPVAAAMAVEMAIYGGVAGIAYQCAPRKGIADIYRALLLAMILGRIGWGIAELVLLTSQGDAFTWQLFFAGAFFNAIPGIIVQLLLIPAIMAAIERSGYAKEA